MHQSESLRRESREFPNRYSSSGRDATGMKHFLGDFGRFDNIRVRQCRAIAGMSEQVSAEQRTCRFLKQESRLPRMGHVRSIDMAYAFPTQIDDLAIA